MAKPSAKVTEIRKLSRSGLLAALVLASLHACGAVDDPPVPGVTEAIWTAGPPLPMPVSNNAVAAVSVGSGTAVFSFLGIDSTKVWSGVTNAAFRWDVGDAAWREIDSVPGPGRLASTAEVVRRRVYLIGGYTVGEDGSERSVPDVNIYDPVTDVWTRGADIPLPTDDAVSGVWRDSLIVLVSGWHDTGNVPNVQFYDPTIDAWSAATPIVGTPVFGHSGAVAGDQVVYVDGTAVVDGSPRFAIAAESWAGHIDGAGDALAGRIERPGITWTALEPHPGPPLYRAAGGVIGAFAVFLGGSDNPYNYNGLGYDGRPAEPLRQLLAYDTNSDAWRFLPAPPVATMDHRNLGVAGGRVFLVGGMVEGQVVTDAVWTARAERLLTPIR